MPQLNKGGKFVFGLSLIHDDLTVQFPTQALEEYQVLNDDKIIIFTGSKVTGGFCVTTYPLLSKSKLSHILHECPQLEKQSIPRGTLVTYKGRKYAWLPLKENGSIQFTSQLLKQLNLDMPFTYSLFKMFAKSHMKKKYPIEGFTVKWRRYDYKEIHFDIVRCIYKEMCEKYCCPELCTVFCQSDVTAFAGYKPKIRFERLGTIGEGANCCDFHFIRGK